MCWCALDKLVEISKSFLGTPHINGAMVKGAGVDCCTLPILIYKELGLLNIEESMSYSCDWFCKKNCEEILLPYLNKYCNSVEDLQPADLVSFRWGRSNFAHLAMYIGDGKFIHSNANNGVEIVSADCPYFFDKQGYTRITGYWRLKNEFSETCKK